MKKTEHQFALYVPSLVGEVGTEFVIDQSELVHRICHVVRLTTGDELVLFNHAISCCVKIVSLSKKQVGVTIVSCQPTTTLHPYITVLLPVLRKAALHEAVYACSQLGANSIQLVITDKGQHAWVASELERLHKVVIAAAEQSKHFSFPEIRPPKKLPEVVASLSHENFRIFFDPAGCPAEQTFAQLKNQRSNPLVLLWGPEGDLTESEKNYVTSHQFIATQLTPTVLRAEHAVMIGLGIVRTLF